MMRHSVEPLFQPFTLPGLELANRLVMAPMTRGFAPGGVPLNEVAHYYRRRAEGGVGLIVTEGIIVDHPAAQGASGQGDDLPVLHGEQAFAAWRNVVAAVHGAGVPIVPQLWHMGVMREDGCPPYPDVPSSRPSGLWGLTDRDSAIPMERRLRQAPPTEPMSEKDIADVIAAFAASAKHAMAVGFDARQRARGPADRLLAGQIYVRVGEQQAGRLPAQFHHRGLEVLAQSCIILRAVPGPPVELIFDTLG